MSTMNPTIVAERVQRIFGLSGDPEAAHQEDDTLRADILRAIGDGTIHDADECARIALETEDGLTRWYA